MLNGIYQIEKLTFIIQLKIIQECKNSSLVR